MTKGLYILGQFETIYGPEEQRDIAERVDIYAPPQTPKSVLDNPAILRDCEIILSGWGGPKLDEAFMAAVPNLRAFFYGAGSIRGIVTDAFWARGIPICSSWAANALPVAEYTLSQIFWCLKKGYHYARHLREGGAWWQRCECTPGAYGSTVALISLGMIGRRVVELLKPFDLEVVAYDPFVTPADAQAVGVRLVSLEEAFRLGDVVSLHTPWLEETVGMITGELLGSMKPHAAFLNTSRGAVVREDEMIAVLQNRPDLHAVLDVTYPEPPVAGSPLYTLPNVTLTPHIAGSMGRECHRMGRYMVGEVDRFLKGEPLKWSLTKEQAERMA